MMTFSKPRVVPGSFSTLPNHLEGKTQGEHDPHAEIEKHESLTVVEARASASSIGSSLKLLPGDVSATLEDGTSQPALGIVMEIADPGAYVPSMIPTILTGLAIAEERLSLPGGCSAIYLSDYDGPQSRIDGSDELTFVIAFPAASCDRIADVSFPGGG